MTEPRTDRTAAVATHARLRAELPVVRTFLARVEARLNRITPERRSTFEPPPNVPGWDQYRRAVAAEVAAMEAVLAGGHGGG